MWDAKHGMPNVICQTWYAKRTYFAFAQLVEVWLEDVELDALVVTVERDATDEENEEHDKREDRREIYNLKTTFREPARELRHTQAVDEDNRCRMKEDLNRRPVTSIDLNRKLSLHTLPDDLTPLMRDRQTMVQARRRHNTRCQRIGPRSVKPSECVTPSTSVLKPHQIPYFVSTQIVNLMG